MKLLVSSLLFLLGKAVVAHDDCPAEEESGYEVWRSLPPRQARVQFEADVNCTTETYTLTYSFMPDYVSNPMLYCCSRCRDQLSLICVEQF